MFIVVEVCTGGKKKKRFSGRKEGGCKSEWSGKKKKIVRFFEWRAEMSVNLYNSQRGEKDQGKLLILSRSEQVHDQAKNDNVG